jgi:hypothetical protein
MAYTDNRKDYQIFKIPKRSGGERTIEAPKPDLKIEQYALLAELEGMRLYSPFAHGGLRGRNTITCVLPHVGKKFVALFDVKNFYPSIDIRIFQKECPAETRKNNAFINKVAKGFLFEGDGVSPMNHLPQGAPTSPMLANIFMMRTDWTFARFAQRYFDASFTRYVDELIFSSDAPMDFRQLKFMVQHQLYKISLKMNDEKIRFFKPASRKIILGVAINEKLNVPRELKKNLRAALHQVKIGLRKPDSVLNGELAYVNAIVHNEKKSVDSRELVKIHNFKVNLGKAAERLNA